jgi:hypothetical protein
MKHFMTLVIPFFVTLHLMDLLDHISYSADDISSAWTFWKVLKLRNQAHSEKHRSKDEKILTIDERYFLKQNILVSFTRSQMKLCFSTR